MGMCMGYGRSFGQAVARKPIHFHGDKKFMDPGGKGGASHTRACQAVESQCPPEPRKHQCVGGSVTSLPKGGERAPGGEVRDGFVSDFFRPVEKRPRCRANGSR